MLCGGTESLLEGARGHHLLTGTKIGMGISESFVWHICILEANITVCPEGILGERRKEKTKEGALCCGAWANDDHIIQDTEKVAEQLMLRKSVCHLKHSYAMFHFIKPNC